MANINLNAKQSVSQKEQILEYLKEGKTINPMIALIEFGCMRLNARINELEKEGYSISHIWLTTSTGKKVMSYKLNGFLPSAL